MYSTGGFAIGSTYHSTDPGANNVAIEGKVGIGTTTPDDILDVTTTNGQLLASDYGVLKLIRGTAGDYGSALQFIKSDNGGAVTDGAILGSVRFFGHDGIDTATEGAQIASIINGTPSANVNPTDIVFKTASTGNDDLAEKVRIMSNGKVGIGTSAPNYKLQVVGNFRASDTGYFAKTSGTGLSVDHGTSFGTIGSDIHKFTGKVGIGTTAPLFNLDVEGSGSQAINVKSTSNHASIVIDRYSTSQDANLTFRTAGASKWRLCTGLAGNDEKLSIYDEVAGLNRLVIQPDGKVGIGTTAPAYQLQIHESTSGTNYVQLTNSTTGSGSGDGLLVGVNAAEDAIFWNLENTAARFATNGIERMRIDSAGNVGIGTTTPTADLEVSTASGGEFLVKKSGSSGVTLQQVNGGDATSGSLSIKAGTSMSLFTGGVNRLLVDGSGHINIDGGNFQMGGTDIINSGLAMYNLESFKLADNKKAYFGSSNDLEIYHDGSHSYIKDTGAGNLVFNGSQIWLKNAANSANMIGAVEGNYVKLYHNGAEKLTTTAAGVTITGQLSATTKSFLIDHPTKPGKKLRHGSLEGPENGVYIRGKSDSNIIELPEYWTKLIDEDSITVQLTPIGKHQHIYVEKIDNNTVYIQSDESRKNSNDLNYFYLILAERKDVDKLVIEE
jgi:hypothetical protein